MREGILESIVRTQVELLRQQLYHLHILVDGHFDLTNIHPLAKRQSAPKEYIRRRALAKASQSVESRFEQHPYKDVVPVIGREGLLSADSVRPFIELLASAVVGVGTGPQYEKGALLLVALQKTCIKKPAIAQAFGKNGGLIVLGYLLERGLKHNSPLDEQLVLMALQTLDKLPQLDHDALRQSQLQGTIKALDAAQGDNVATADVSGAVQAMAARVYGRLWGASPPKPPPSAAVSKRKLPPAAPKEREAPTKVSSKPTVPQRQPQQQPAVRKPSPVMELLVALDDKKTIDRREKERIARQEARRYGQGGGLKLVSGAPTSGSATDQSALPAAAAAEIAAVSTTADSTVNSGGDAIVRPESRKRKRVQWADDVGVQLVRYRHFVRTPEEIEASKWGMGGGKGGSKKAASQDYKSLVKEEHRREKHNISMIQKPKPIAPRVKWRRPVAVTVARAQTPELTSPAADAETRRMQTLPEVQYGTEDDIPNSPGERRLEQQARGGWGGRQQGVARIDLYYVLPAPTPVPPSQAAVDIVNLPTEQLEQLHQFYTQGARVPAYPYYSHPLNGYPPPPHAHPLGPSPLGPVVPPGGFAYDHYTHHGGQGGS